MLDVRAGPRGSETAPDVFERIVFTAQFGAGITAALERRQQSSRSEPCAGYRRPESQQAQKPEPRQPWPVAVSHRPVERMSPDPARDTESGPPMTLLGEKDPAGVVVVPDPPEPGG